MLLGDRRAGPLDPPDDGGGDGGGEGVVAVWLRLFGRPAPPPSKHGHRFQSDVAGGPRGTRTRNPNCRREKEDRRQ